MNINDYDKTIDNARFLTKIDNTFVMLLSSVMMGDMQRVNHKISDNVFEKYNNYVTELNNKNQRQMYDELNVKDSSITNIIKDDNGITVSVHLTARYMDYIVDKSSFDVISGNNSSRIMKEYTLTFYKSNDAIEMGIVRKCPGCGNSIDISYDGKCKFCGSIFNTEKYDYVLVDIKLV